MKLLIINLCLLCIACNEEMAFENEMRNLVENKKVALNRIVKLAKGINERNKKKEIYLAFQNILPSFNNKIDENELRIVDFSTYLKEHKNNYPIYLSEIKELTILQKKLEVDALIIRNDKIAISCQNNVGAELYYPLDELPTDTINGLVNEDTIRPFTLYLNDGWYLHFERMEHGISSNQRKKDVCIQ